MNNPSLKSSHSYQGLPLYLQQRTDSPSHRPQPKQDFHLSNDYRQIAVTYKQANQEHQKNNYSPLTFNLNAPPRSKLRKAYYPNYKTGVDIKQEQSHRNDDSWSKKVEDFSKISSKNITNWSTSSNNRSLLTPRSSQKQQQWDSGRKQQTIINYHQSTLYAKPQSISRDLDFKSTSTTSKQNHPSYLDSTQYSTLLQQNQFQKKTIDSLHNEIVKMKSDLGLPDKKDYQKWTLSKQSSQKSSQNGIRMKNQQEERLQNENNCLKEQIQTLKQEAVNKNQLNQYLQGQCKHYIASYQKNVSELKSEQEKWKDKENTFENQINLLRLQVKKMKETHEDAQKDYQFQRQEIARLNRCIDAQANKLAQQENNMQVDKSQINFLLMKLENIQSKNQQLNLCYKQALTEVEKITSELEKESYKAKQSEELRRQLQQYKQLIEQARRQERERRETAYREEAASQEAFKVLQHQVTIWHEKFNAKEQQLNESQAQRAGLQSYIQSLESMQHGSMEQQEAQVKKYINQLHVLTSQYEALQSSEGKLRQQLEKSQRKVEKCESKIFKLKGKLQGSEQILNQNEAKKNQLTMKLSRLQQKQAFNEKNMQEMKKELQIASINVKIKEQEILKIMQSLEKTERKLIQSQVDIAEMNEALETSKSRAHSLQLNKKALETQYQALQTKNQAIEAKNQAYEQQIASLQQLLQVLNSKIDSQDAIIKQREIKIQYQEKIVLQIENKMLNQNEQYNKKNQELEEQIKKFEEKEFTEESPTKKLPESPVKDNNYVQVDRQGLNYICKILDCQPVEDNIINTIIQSLIARFESFAPKQYNSVCYTQLLQLLGIEEGPNCQEQLIKQIEGLRQSLALIIGRVKQLEWKSEQLIKQNKSILKHKRHEKNDFENHINDNIRLIELNECLSEQVSKANAKLCNARMQTKEMLNCLANNKGKPDMQISIEQQFFTAKSMGSIEC